jgi:hypothetical protein
MVAAGHSVAAVARLVGCNVKTIRRHARRDQQFGQLLRTAEFKTRHDPLKIMKRYAGSSWRAAAWLLERSDPQRYGKQRPLTCKPEEVSAAFSRLIESALLAIDDEQCRRSAFQILTRCAQEETARLFLPPGARDQQSEREAMRNVEYRRLDDLLETFRPPRRLREHPQSPKLKPAILQ